MWWGVDRPSQNQRVSGCPAEPSALVHSHMNRNYLPAGQLCTAVHVVHKPSGLAATGPPGGWLLLSHRQPGAGQLGRGGTRAAPALGVRHPYWSWDRWRLCRDMGQWESLAWWMRGELETSPAGEGAAGVPHGVLGCRVGRDRQAYRCPRGPSWLQGLGNKFWLINWRGKKALPL